MNFPNPQAGTTQLTPLDDALAVIARTVSPVAPVTCAPAMGGVLAQDVQIAADVPSVARALHSGWAVRADETMDGGAYAGAPLSSKPIWVEAGTALPPDCDAVAPFETIDLTGACAQARLPLAPGAGVAAIGADAGAGTVLRAAAQQLRALDVAVLQAAGIADVSVRRPRIAIVALTSHAQNMIAPWLAAMLACAGAAVVTSQDVTRPEALRARFAIPSLADTTDALFVIGTESEAVAMLRAHGDVPLHGVGLTPGDTAAIGLLQSKPVLATPDRLDAALAVWLTLGRALSDALSGRRDDALPVTGRLTRKITSTIGMVDVVPVFVDHANPDAGASVTPLARDHLGLSALARANGWIAVPAMSEGYPAGAPVSVRGLA
jgi:molybdopterin biosynthesis enzyme